MISSLVLILTPQKKREHWKWHFLCDSCQYLSPHLTFCDSSCQICHQSYEQMWALKPAFVRKWGVREEKSSKVCSEMSGTLLWSLSSFVSQWSFPAFQLCYPQNSPITIKFHSFSKLPVSDSLVVFQFSIPDIHSLSIILCFHCHIFFPSHPLYSGLQFQGHCSSSIVVFFVFLCTYLTSLLYSSCSLIWITSSSLSFSDSYIPRS